ncbi:sulfite exporter TauE/SafE family protein [Bradyrhizobium genosp. P]|uniref:sulfite exporter TauE/SafE family protein n=1 Tax=Bradyrhizobium genosp. P TaxID=83641 RepID=UPI003CEE8098
MRHRRFPFLLQAAMLAVFFGVISLLYATVGQAGGTAFLALMAFAAFPPSEMPTALALNIVAATYSTWVFNREKVVDWRKLRPLLLSSLPTAFAGGFIVLDEHVYKTTTGAVLLLAGAAMILRREPAADRDRETPLWGGLGVGAVVGLVSGLTGVGGGVFLAPTLIALRWAAPKQTAALSAPFILANSAVGLVAVLLAGQFPSSYFGLYAVAALGGAVVGTMIGLRWLSQVTTRYILGVILIAAGTQLLCF